MATFLFGMFFAALTAFFLPQAAAGRVEMTVTGIQAQKGGEISAGIFTEPNFPKVGKQLIGREVPVSAPTQTIVFENVPPGTYAFVAFQDMDKNKLLKTNLAGFPTEPIGFSRDARIQFGPPAFNDAKLAVESGKTLRITLTLR